MKLKLLEASEEVYERLENAGVITRLMPGRHSLKVMKGQSDYKSLYESDDYGPHKLITVTINKKDVDHLIYHSDDEDFWVIDELHCEDLILIFSLLKYNEFITKLNDNTLAEEDIMGVKIPKNNPKYSYFTLHKGYPHMESVVRESDNPPSFFVTECRDLDENRIDILLEV